MAFKKFATCAVNIEDVGSVQASRYFDSGGNLKRLVVRSFGATIVDVVEHENLINADYDSLCAAIAEERANNGA